MPFRKSYKRKYTRRPFRSMSRRPRRSGPRWPTKTKSRSRKMTLGANSVSIQRGYLPFAAKMFIKLPYSSTRAMTTSADTSAVSEPFRMGSLYDPFVAVGGHQPYQFNQIEAMYGAYIVHGFKYSITFSDPNNEAMWVGVVVRDNDNTNASPVGKTLENIREKRLSVMKPIAQSGSQERNFKGYVALHQIVGKTKAQYLADDSFAAVINANPLHQLNFEAVTVNVSSNISSVTYSVFLTYYAQLLEYKSPVFSN